MKKQFVDSVRALKLKIVGYDGDFEIAKDRWWELSRQCQQVTNMIWQTWLFWHIQNGSRDKLVAWLNASAVDKKAAGKCPVEAVPKELSKLIYDTLKASFPKLHGRVWGLIQKKAVSGIKKRKASRGSLPGWSAILLNHEAVPSFTKPMPILFDKENSPANTPVRFVENKPTVQIRIERGDGGSDVERFTLAYLGRRIGSQVAISQKIASGEYRFMGSMLFGDLFDGKWYVSLCYQRTSEVIATLQPDKELILFPSAFAPFRAVVEGEPIDLQCDRDGRSRHIEAVRRRCFEERRSRSQNYRFTDAGKGKGRTRAIRLKRREALSRKWREFVKRINNAVSSDIVKLCRRYGCGTVRYFAPSGDKSNTRLISRTGATGDQSTWEFFQLGTMLKHKCEEVGIKLVTAKFGGESAAA